MKDLKKKKILPTSNFWTAQLEWTVIFFFDFDSMRSLWTELKKSKNK